MRPNRDSMGRTMMVALALVASSTMTGCAVIEGIFKAGVWVGVVVVVVIVGLVGGVAAMFRRT